MRRELSIIIPAAGTGKRMKSYGPKPLIELTNHHTVIGRQIGILQHVYPRAEIIVVVGHEADLVMKHLSSNSHIKPVENEYYETSNVVRSLGMGLRIASHRNVLIIYGDLVFNNAAVQIVGGNSVAVMDNRGMMRDEEVGATIVDGRITQFSYDLKTKWAQIAFLTGRELELFKSAVWNRDHNRWFGFEALNKVIEAGGTIRAIEPKTLQIAEIDTAKDIEAARKIGQ